MTEQIAAAELAERTDRLCVNLGEVLHAMAQPLTVLQVRLNMGATLQMEKKELRALAEDSSKEVQRLCNLFGYLNAFLAAESAAPEMSVQALRPLLEHVAEGLRLFFEGGGVGLQVESEGGAEAVVVDRMRVCQALSRVLLVAFEMSSAGDVVELTGCGSRVVVRNGAAQMPLGRDAGLKMALAQANVARQGGRMRWTESPFEVGFELRGAADPGVVGGAL